MDGRFLKKDKKANRCYLACDRAVLGKVSEDLQPKIYITDEINPHDVLFGQGGQSNNHEGNVRYLKVVAQNRPIYDGASPTEKAATVQNVVVKIASKGGRFLKKDKISNQWCLATNRAVREKVAQALRDKNTTKKARTDKRKRYSK